MILPLDAAGSLGVVSFLIVFVALCFSSLRVVVCCRVVCPQGGVRSVAVLSP